MTKQNIFVIIPAYNEGYVITKVIKSIKKVGYINIVLVDDGSDDSTYVKAREANITVLRHFINRGKGASIKTGIEAAKILKADIVVTIDGDGQHNSKDIKKLIENITQGYDVVLGVRKKHINTMPLVKKIANYTANVMMWLLYGIWVADSQCGLRAYSKNAIYSIDTTHDQYEYDSEVIREIKQKKLKYIEVPIETNYTIYSLNKKQKQTFVGGIKTLFKLMISTV